MMDPTYLKRLIETAIAEDLADGDHTSLACIPEDATDQVVLLAKQDGIVAGISVARAIFAQFDPEVEIRELLQDGSSISPGDEILRISGKTRSLLQMERLVLNFMQRMSGIATQTHAYARLIAHTKARVLDTRKTTPGLRMLEKEAVRLGGGANHRMGLYDMIMIKDNHVDFSGGITQAVERVNTYLQRKQKNLPIVVETRTFEEIKEALAIPSIDRIMLDNFSVADTREAVKLINGQKAVESSGNITHANIAEYAECGVDYISVGALTHQIKSLDLSMKATKL